MKATVTKAKHNWRALSEARFNRKALNSMQLEEVTDFTKCNFSPLSTVKKEGNNPQLRNILSLEGQWSGIKRKHLAGTGKANLCLNIVSGVASNNKRTPSSFTCGQFNLLLDSEQSPHRGSLLNGFARNLVRF